MSSKDEFSNLEQDAPGPGDDLPTYDDLATQSGPNSRLDHLQIITTTAILNTGSGT